MPREKQRVFSARTTEESLKTLNELKARLGVGWDGLVIDAVSAHYGVDVPKPPRVERPPKKGKKPKARKKVEAGKQAKEGEAKAKTEAKAETGEG